MVCSSVASHELDGIEGRVIQAAVGDGHLGIEILVETGQLEHVIQRRHHVRAGERLAVVEGDVVAERDLHLAAVVGKAVRIGQLGLGLIIVVDLKQPLVDQIQQAHHVAMVQFQRAKGEVIVRHDGDGEGRGTRARPAAGRTSSAQASSSAAKREMRMNKAPYDSVGSGVSTGK